MSKPERLALYVLLLALVIVIGRGNIGGAARATVPGVGEPAAQRLATCDVYEAIRVLVDSDKYKPVRVEAQDKAKSELQAMADEIRGMESRLKGMDPKTDEALDLFKQYNIKKQQFSDRQRELDEFLGNQFVDAYEQVRKAVDAVAEKRGYTHVIASRRQDDKPSNDMEKVTQSMLSRPMLKAPQSDDITDDVLAELKL